MNIREIKNEIQGITIISLIVTIVILIILAGIGVNSGKDVIIKAKLEELRTNMLLIEAKAKEYVENANFKLGIKIDEAEDKAERINKAKGELKGSFIENTSQYSNVIGNNEEYVYYYQLNESDLSDMGLSKIETDGIYIIKYDIKNIQVEVYNTKGFESKGTTYYALSDIENLDV